MKWIRPQLICLKANYMDLGKKLQDMEIPLRGMEIALSFCTSFPVGMIDDELKHVLQSFKSQIGLKLEQAKCSAPFDATTAPEGKGEALDGSLWKVKTTSSMHDNMSALFLLYCMELFLDRPPVAEDLQNTLKHDNKKSNEMLHNLQKAIKPSRQSLVFAFKCSLSLGLAVFFGLLYNKENGYWSGLTIAISLVTGRQATFTDANARVQGTAMGSVYGVLCLFVFQKVLELRLLALLPWIIISSFLMHSRIYGKAGGIAAAIGALLIVGRTNYGPPSEFAIARLTEASIGLLCLILVEVLLDPVRAATLARTELSHSMAALRECITSIALLDQQKSTPASKSFRGKQQQLKYHVNKLEMFIEEAELEPNFWFLPFHTSCYSKLLESLTTTVDLLLFISYQIDFLAEASQDFRGIFEELQQQMNEDLKQFTEEVGSSLKFLAEATSTPSLKEFNEALQIDNSAHEVELGKSGRHFSANNKDYENIVSCFIQHLEEFSKKYSEEGSNNPRNQMLLCLMGLGFCIQSLARETMEIENQVRELVKWEKP